MGIDIINICENAKTTINSVVEDADKIRYVTDMSKVILNYDDFGFNKEYILRDNLEVVKNEKIIRAQKSALQSAICVLLNIKDWPNKEEEIREYMDSEKGEELSKTVVNGYKYCIDKGYLDIAELYLYGLISLGIAKEIVDELFVKKALLDISAGYAQIAIDTDTDQSGKVDHLTRKINSLMYGDILKCISNKEIANAYNDMGVLVNLNGDELVIEPKKRINHNDLKIKNNNNR